MCSGSETGSHLRLIDFVHHSTLGLGVIKKKKVGVWCFLEAVVSLLFFITLKQRAE